MTTSAEPGDGFTVKFLAWFADVSFIVTGGTGRCIDFTTGHEFTMNPLLEFLPDGAVTLPAGLGDIKEVDGRLGTARRQDAVGRAPGGVAIVAGSGGVDTPGGGLAVHTLLVHFDGVLELDVQISQEFLIFVAGSAGRRQIRGVNHGLRIGMGQDVVAAMALLTGGNIG